MAIVGYTSFYEFNIEAENNADAKNQKINILRNFKHLQLNNNWAKMEIIYDGENERGILCNKDGSLYGYTTKFDNSLKNRLLKRINIKDTEYCLYQITSCGSTSIYRYMRVPWIRDMQIPEHLMVTIIWGMWDNIKNLKGLDVCHRIAVTEENCDNSVKNLFVDTHEFNCRCRDLTKALNTLGFKYTISIDRDNFSDWCSLLGLFTDLETHEIKMGRKWRY